MGEAPPADKGNMDVAPTRSPHSVCLGDDVSSREQPVHPGITDGLVVAAWQDPAGRKGTVCTCPSLTSSPLRGEGEVFHTGNVVTASRVPSSENPTSHNLKGGHSTRTPGYSAANTCEKGSIGASGKHTYLHPNPDLISKQRFIGELCKTHKHG